MLKRVGLVLLQALGYVMVLLFAIIIIWVIAYSFYLAFTLSRAFFNLLTHDYLLSIYNMSSLLIAFTMYIFSGKKTDDALGKLVFKLEDHKGQHWFVSDMRRFGVKIEYCNVIRKGLSFLFSTY